MTRFQYVQHVDLAACRLQVIGKDVRDAPEENVTTKTSRRRRATAKPRYLLHLTAREVATLRLHVDPPDGLERYLPVGSVGPLVGIELTGAEVDDFLRLVEETANHAQNIEDGARLSQTFQRLEDGLADATDPSAHLLRPAASTVGYSLKQGRYLAFIYWYTQVHRRAPAEADLEVYFRVSPPSVHGVLKTLERRGFIKRRPGVGRSIQLQLRPDQIPALDDGLAITGTI